MRNEWFIVFYLLISLFCIRSILVNYGVIGYRHDWNYPQYGELISHRNKLIIYPWVRDNLGFSPIYHSTAIYDLLIYFLSSIGVGGVFITKLLLFSFLFFSGTFMFFLSSFFVKKRFAFYSGLFYMLNPVIFNKIIAGHVIYLFGYSLIPLAFLLFIKKKNLLAGLITSLVFTQPQFIILFSGMLILFSLFFKKFIKNSLIIIFIALLIHSFWIFNSINNDSISFVKHAVNDETIINRSLPIYVVSLLIGYYYFINAIGNLFLFWVISGVLILLIIIINLRFNRVTLFLVTLTIIGLFLSKGSSWPLGSLFTNIPFIRLFREIQHFLVIPAFSYSLLIGLVAQRLKSKSLILLPLILIFGLPFLSGNLGGQVQQFTWNDDYHKIMIKLLYDPSDYRVLWLPMNQPIKSINASFAGVDSMINYSPKPSFNQMISSYSDANLVTAFLFNNINDYRISNLLRFLNVKYVFLRHDFVSRFFEFNFLRSNKTISFNLSFLNKTDLFNVSNGVVDSFIINDSLPIVYAADKSILISDNLNGLLYDYNCSRPVLFFAAQSPTKLINLTDEVIIRNNDFLVMNSTIIQSALFSNISNASNGWAPLFDYTFGWWWFNNSYTSEFGNGILSLKSNSSIIIPVNNSSIIGIKSYGLISVNGLIINSSSLDWSFINNSFNKLFITNLGNQSFIADIRLINNLTFINERKGLIHNVNISVNRINPTLIYVSVNNSRPFFLVFSESFDKDWVATINNTKLPHYEANGFANAWYVNNTGNHKIIIYYEKQAKSVNSIIITLLFFIVPIFIKYWGFIKKLFFNEVKRILINEVKWIINLFLFIYLYINLFLTNKRVIKQRIVNLNFNKNIIPFKLLAYSLFIVSCYYIIYYFNLNITSGVVNLFLYIIFPLLILKFVLKFVYKNYYFKRFNKNLLPLICYYLFFLLTSVFLLPSLIISKYVNGFIHSHLFFIFFFISGLFFYKFRIDSRFLFFNSIIIIWFITLFPININLYLDILLEEISVFSFYSLITGLILELMINYNIYKPKVFFNIKKLSINHFIILSVLSLFFNFINPLLCFLIVFFGIIVLIKTFFSFTY